MTIYLDFGVRKNIGKAPLKIHQKNHIASCQVQMSGLEEGGSNNQVIKKKIVIHSKTVKAFGIEGWV